MEIARGTREMIAGMTPRLTAGDVVFCTAADAELVARAAAEALGLFREDEGVTLVLPVDVAEEFGFAVAMPMRRIVLDVYSALDGVGLTAAVAGALAAQGIACNMVAAFHHDHVFVPAHDADRAIGILRSLQAGAG